MGGIGIGSSLSHGFIMAWDDVDEDFHFRLEKDHGLQMCLDW